MFSSELLRLNNLIYVFCLQFDTPSIVVAIPWRLRAEAPPPRLLSRKFLFGLFALGATYLSEPSVREEECVPGVWAALPMCVTMGDISDLDRQIEQLRRCELIKENEVKALCAKAR